MAVPLAPLGIHKHMTQNISLVEIQKEVTLELANKEAVAMLLKTTFKRLSPEVMHQAITEGMIRGFTFKDFLERNIYAVPFRDTYSLVTSIDHARKIGMRSGIVGNDEPTYAEEPELGLACSVTVKKRFADGYVGDFTAKVYFKEYYIAGKNGYPSLWDSKPRTMIAKVAEMHALRMACPEELSQSYVEEEVEREIKSTTPTLDKERYIARLDGTTTLDELKTAWAALPPEVKVELETYKESLKKKYETGEVHE